MEKNVGGIDRILRIVVGLGLISLVYVGPQTPWGWSYSAPLSHCWLLPGLSADRHEYLLARLAPRAVSFG